MHAANNNWSKHPEVHVPGLIWLIKFAKIEYTLVVPVDMQMLMSHSWRMFQEFRMEGLKEAGDRAELFYSENRENVSSQEK
jgi:hypothetical protein